jgi:hypothetical protein
MEPGKASRLLKNDLLANSRSDFQQPARAEGSSPLFTAAISASHVAGSQLYLRTDLHHAVRRDAEEARGRGGVARQE